MNSRRLSLLCFALIALVSGDEDLGTRIVSKSVAVEPPSSDRSGSCRSAYLYHLPRVFCFALFTS